MDLDGPSSPVIPSSLPPSSVPVATASTNNGTPRRQFTDALAMGGREADEENQEAGGNRRRRRPRQANGDVPMVRDAVGESVAESFETFLKT
jgi:DNA replication licensing factor MCM6